MIAGEEEEFSMSEWKGSGDDRHLYAGGSVVRLGVLSTTGDLNVRDQYRYVQKIVLIV